MRSLLAFCVLLLASQALSKQVRDGETPAQQSLDPFHLPINIVGEVGSTVVLSCGVENPEIAHSLIWYEYAYTPGGGLISDNDLVLGHPEAARYTILNNVAGYYDLQISDARFADGGTYMCMDSQAVAPNKRQHAAQLTIVGAEPNCTTTIGENNIVLEHAYHSNDCLLDYKGGIIPNISWSGIGPFNSAYVANDVQVWGGMHFNATRNMEGRAHYAIVYFTDYFLPVDANSASNVPDYSKPHAGRDMQIRSSMDVCTFRGPTGTQASPIKPSYEPGDLIVCTADANPNATFNWANMRTLEVIAGDTIRIEEAWRGNNDTLRCQSRNYIEGTEYTQNIFINAYIPELTSPTTTTPGTTTTIPPAVSECGDLTGAWESFSPTRGAVCIRLNLESNGLLTGLMRNASDTYWIDIVGRAQAARFDQVGFNGIWPFDIGVSSFVGECHRCFGEEQLLVNVLSRIVSDTCGVKGETRYTSQYLFTRSTAISCPNLPLVM